LSNSNGDSCQSYEYSAYGQVAASDPNHPNPYMFTGRRFDIETGLYYYRARYYNPHIGRFMQTDPVGYGAGMNLYAYCGNNPIGRADPSGLYYTFLSEDHEKAIHGKLTFAWVEGVTVDDEQIWGFDNVDKFCDWALNNNDRFSDAWREEQIGYLLSTYFTEVDERNEEGEVIYTYTQEWFFWRIKALMYYGGNSTIPSLEDAMRREGNKRTVNIRLNLENLPMQEWDGTTGYIKEPGSNNIRIYWNHEYTGHGAYHTLVPLAHELSHAADWVWDGIWDGERTDIPHSKTKTHRQAIQAHLSVANMICKKDPNWGWVQVLPD